ncbi:hypothetical protein YASMINEVIRUS_549 [Yasminevirus sp. GU-2018]|uniref:Uncharacterized protein n=1 Tax=Yasminevirus sp. GU-2018 TaxID=2420051 RepID=A0A5K0UAG8_9VIRU|nr:hypothetical protein YASMINEVIRUS_549 [Yasminevirus sp. GU-2018]
MTKKKSDLKNQSLPSNKVVKVKLSRIVRSEYASKIPAIQEIVNRVSLIVTHTYHFLKLFSINHYQTKKCLPTIDENFVALIMKTVSRTSRKPGKLKESNEIIKLELEQFYDDVYCHLVDELEPIKYDGLTQMLGYEATNIVTSYHNHLKNHFYKLMCRFINLYFDVKGKTLAIRKQCEIDGTNYTDAVNKFRSEMFALKSDIYQSTDKCDPVFDSFKKYFREKIMNNLNIKHTLYGDVNTKVKSDPHKLLLPLLKMSILGEQLVRQKLGDDEKDKLFNVINCFPVRKSNVPKYVKLDTTMLIYLFTKGNKRFYQLNITDQKKCLWNTYFKTGKRIFKKTNYVFNGSILTDGFTACVCFELKGDKSKSKKVKLSEYDNSTQYVTDLSEEDKLRLQSKTLVGIDPGWSDLIFCTNGKTEIIEKGNGKKVHKTETFRFSRQQRRKELKTKRYRDILEDDKRKTVIKGCTVKEAESILSQFNSNSCNYDRCQEYVRIKNRLNYELKEYYQKEIHRKLRWYSYLNKMRSDANIINRFRDKFGSPEDVVILMGDFSKTEVLKGSEPVKGKSVRKLFKDAGYELYLVNEYNTSRKMYETGEDLEKFRKRESARPYKKGTINLVHGLLRIKSKTSNSSTELIETDSTSQSEIEYNPQKMISKTTIINRDLNGALNIRLKGKMQLLNRNIPEYLKRTKIVEDIKEMIEKTIRMPSKRAKVKVEVKEKIVKVIRRTSSVEPTGSLLRKKQLARSE